MDYLMEVGLLSRLLSNMLSSKFHLGLPNESLEQTFKRLIQNAVHVPTRPGLLLDFYALVSSFFFSLAPTWSPHPNPLPPVPPPPQEEPERLI